MGHPVNNDRIRTAEICNEEELGNQTENKQKCHAKQCRDYIKVVYIQQQILHTTHISI